MDLTEAEDIKKRQKEYIEELYKKDLHDRDNHDGMITHISALLTMPKPLTVWITINCGKF